MTLMLIVGVTAFFFHELRLWGPWRPIHLIAVYTVVMLPVGCGRAGTTSRPTARP